MALLSFLKTISHAYFQDFNAPESLQDDIQILDANMSVLKFSQTNIRDNNRFG